jgi:hypothetical protein
MFKALPSHPSTPLAIFSCVLSWCGSFFSITQLPYLEQCTTTTKEHHVPLVLVRCNNAMTNEYGLPLFRLLQQCDNNDHRGVMLLWFYCCNNNIKNKIRRNRMLPFHFNCYI